MSNETKKTTHPGAEATYDHVLKYMGIFGGVEGLKRCIQFVKTKFAAIYLGTEGNGIADKYSNVAEIINSTTNCGLGFSSVRSVGESYERDSDEELRRHIRTVRTLCLWSAIFAGVICLCGAPLISKWVFGSGDHTLGIMLLSLLVVSMPIESGECAVLKGMRQLKRVAAIETLSTFSTLLTAVPLYWWLGVKGVIYAMVLSQLVITAIHLSFSVTLVPYRVNLFSLKVIRQGVSLIRVGLPFAVAALAQAFMVGAVIHYIGDDHQVGIYGKGILLLSLYASLAFTAMDVDFFPRLSAVNRDKERINHLVNQQIDSCSMLLSPLLLLLIVLLPIIVPLIFTHEFLPVVPMCTCAVFHIFFKGLNHPVEYIPLARGHSLVYLIVEVLFYALNYVLIRFLYDEHGLTGIGVAMSISLFVEMIFVYLLYHKLYSFVPKTKTLGYIAMQIVFLGVATLVAMLCEEWVRYAVIIPLTLLSGFVSVRLLGDKFTFYRRLKHRLTHSSGNCDCCK